MALTGYTPADGGRLTRGFRTEAIAESTLRVVWCLLAHCPGSARDWDEAATEASCAAHVNTIAGFLERKRPIPRLREAGRGRSGVGAPGGALLVLVVFFGSNTG